MDTWSLIPAVQLKLDVTEFIRGMKVVKQQTPATASKDQIQAAKSALGLYKGKLLSGFDESWIGAERERLTTLYLDGLRWLMHAQSLTGEADAALETGRRILREDPLCDFTQTEMLRLLIVAGRRGDAVRHYRKYKEILAERIGPATDR